jgi:hypothetical protein
MTIENCRVTANQYMRHLCLMFLADNWLWMVLPVALCAVLAIWVDVRFVIVAMMVVLMVLPMLLALLYFYYGFSPEARWSIMEKQVDLTDEGLALTFTDERMKKHVIRWDDVHSIIEKDDAVMLMLTGGRRFTCLMLPASVVNPDVAQLLREFVPQTH